MTARVLVVDDVEANVKLLQTYLEAEYFEVLTAYDGLSALQICAENHVDIILLDIMMPGMDGFEVCRRLKKCQTTAHIPVVMVTALDQPADRVEGLRAGADDFLTKPINNLQLMARVKSLLRLKVLNDELRLRAGDSGLFNDDEIKLIGRDQDARKGDALLIDGAGQSQSRIMSCLEKIATIKAVSDHADGLSLAQANSYEYIIITDNVPGSDPLRLCSQLRSQEHTRFVPILLVVPIGEDQKVIKALEMGVNDYIIQPLDPNELVARSVTQIRRSRSTAYLRQILEKSVELAVVDPLTGLNNRHFLDSYMDRLLVRATRRDVPISAYLADIDHFKSVNDAYGHDAGDNVLKEFAHRLKKEVRSADLVCRLGGEEFLVLMPDTDHETCMQIAERFRKAVESRPFVLNTQNEQKCITVSLGVTQFDFSTDNASSFIKRADDALYEAKNSGRNQAVKLLA